MLRTASPLKVAVIGAGKIGSTFAFQLARLGHHDVTVIARPGSQRLGQLRRDDGIVNVKGERAAVRVLDTLDERTRYDLIIVTLLAHQIDAIMSSLQRSVAVSVQFMFNAFNPERFSEAIGRERCTFGMACVQATLDPEGRLKATIGAGGQKTLMGEQRWVDVFIAAGLPAALEPDMPLWLRNHAALCVAFESVSIAGVRRGGGASWGEAKAVARSVHASFALIKALGFDIYPRSNRLIDRAPIAMTATALWSASRIRSFRELLATGKAERDAIVDDMIASSAKQSVDVSAIRAMKSL